MVSMEMTLEVTGMEPWTNFQPVVTRVIKEVGAEGETMMKERSAIDTGRLMGSISAKHFTAKSVIVGASQALKYSSFADIIGLWKFGLHGPQFVGRTKRDLVPELPRIAELIMDEVFK